MCCVVIGLEKGHGSTDAAVERKVENLDDDGDVLLLLTTTTNNNDVVVINKNTHCGVLVLFLSYPIVFYLFTTTVVVAICMFLLIICPTRTLVVHRLIRDSYFKQCFIV